MVGNFFSGLYCAKRNHARPGTTLAVQLSLDFGVGVAGVVDPSRLIDHVEIKAVVDPQAVPIVDEVVLLIEDPLHVGDGVARLKAVDGADAISVNGRAENTNTRSVGHGGDVARFAARDPSFEADANCWGRGQDWS